MERTLNVESGHLSKRLISTSSCIHDPEQVIQLLTTWVPSHPPLTPALPSSGNDPSSTGVQAMAKGWWHQTHASKVTFIINISKKLPPTLLPVTAQWDPSLFVAASINTLLGLHLP